MHLKGSGNFVLDPLKNPWFSSCCNDNYKPLGQSWTQWHLQADHLSDYQDIYDWKSISNFVFVKRFS